MKRAEHQPDVVAVMIYGGCYVKSYVVLDAGTLIPSHAHHHDHLTAVTAGSIRVWCDDALLGDFTAPAMVKVAARCRHKFLALTPAVGLMCIHSVGAAESVEDGDLIAERHALELED